MLRDKSGMCRSAKGGRKCQIARRTSLVSQPAKHLNSSARSPTRIDRLGLWSSWAGHRHRPRSFCHVPPSFRQRASPSNSSSKDFVITVLPDGLCMIHVRARQHVHAPPHIVVGLHQCFCRLRSCRCARPALSPKQLKNYLPHVTSALHGPKMQNHAAC